ncbi:MAG: putative aminohydrolase SsnA [Chloroflexi bacterium]|nr:putative aminohydrolase SsnA [Chloroflexota bacterium]
MLITHGAIATLGKTPRLIDDGALHFANGRIDAVGTTAELSRQFPGDETLDVHGQLVMPGNVCSHTHFYGAFARGMALRGEPPKNFVEILEKLWWRLDRALLMEDIRYSALVCLVDAIRHGTTSLIDHHASPSEIDGSLDTIAAAAIEAGVRVACAYEVTDRNGDDGAAAGIAENVRFLQAQKQHPHPLIGASFGLHASFTLSDKTLDRSVAAARALNAGFHVHVAEDKADQADCLKKYNRKVVERFDEAQILGAQTIAAHCVHVDAYEMDILRETRTKVTHQPRSNMNNAVGTQATTQLLKRGICVGLGNDGFSNDMFMEMKAAYLAHKQAAGDPRVMGADDVMRVAVGNNAQIAALFWSDPVGALEPGAAADIVLLDYRPITPLDAGNLPWHIIFGAGGSNVTTTICAGKLLMKDRVLLTLDEAAIAAKAREHAAQVWKRI